VGLADDKKGGGSSAPLKGRDSGVAEKTVGFMGEGGHQKQFLVGKENGIMGPVKKGTVCRSMITRKQRGKGVFNQPGPFERKAGSLLFSLGWKKRAGRPKPGDGHPSWPARKRKKSSNSKGKWGNKKPCWDNKKKKKRPHPQRGKKETRGDTQQRITPGGGEEP